ncbi:MAG: glycoside hydrolase [Treponema sp.]|nr:glycoside hydrolase [Treponema sp.]
MVKKLSQIFLLFLTMLSVSMSCKSVEVIQFSDRNFTYSPDPDAILFDQLWGYVMNGRESEFSSQIPLTDILYFIAPITSLSEVRQPAPKEKYFGDFRGKVHIVSACDSTAQAHLLLDESLPLREKIISGLVQAAESYDGLQLDWEYIPAKDNKNFHNFLRDLKKRLGSKSLSVAVKARIRTISDDVYDYKTIGSIADKVIIMSYDEHWSTSKPGPIASNEWVRKIADYALSQIPQEKIVMGISFYGRTWYEDSIGSKAWYSGSLQRIIEENNIDDIRRDEDGIPWFTHRHKVTVTGYYDDIPSLRKRCKMLADMGIGQLAFWRIGFEDVGFWKHLKIDESLLDEAPEHSEDIEYAE